MNQSFEHISELILQAKSRATLAVNKELVSLYWRIGEFIYDRVQSKDWGESVVVELASFLNKKHPNAKGFSKANLWRMKQFFETYSQNEKLATLSRELSWSHNLSIMSSAQSEEEQEFYMRFSVREKWSVRELKRQINSSVYERTMLSNEKLSSVMRELPQTAKNNFKDSYILELLDINETHKESDLQRAISKNITSFLLEVGRDFAFMGEQYPLQVGKQDFFIDLLFFNRKLNCMVAIELKTQDFKPGHLGQLNFYLEALDRDVKQAHENPSIGLLLCKNKDDVVVEYALSTSLSPTVVADYKIQLPEKKILQQKWHEILNQVEQDDAAEKN
jgi:predicted nuclease of restriction endonuclease-like (RecB) superfamily